MTSLRDKQRRELHRAILRAFRKHNTVRAAAKALGMPKSTLFDTLARLNLASRP